MHDHTTCSILDNFKSFEFNTENGIKGIRLSESYVRNLTADVIDAVSQIHLNGVIHRDLKPENIMFSFDNNIQLIDFSYSKLINSENAISDSTSCCFEGTIYFCARLKPDANGKFHGHTCPKHDLESVFYIISELCGCRLPWNDELIEIDIQNVDEYLEFKSEISDKDVSDSLPSCLSKAFNYLMNIPETDLPDYDKLKRLLIDPKESICVKSEEKPNHMSNIFSDKLHPIKLFHMNSLIEDPEDEERSKRIEDDSCHACDLSKYRIFPNHWCSDTTIPLRPNTTFSSKIKLLRENDPEVDNLNFIDNFAEMKSLQNYIKQLNIVVDEVPETEAESPLFIG